MKKNKSLLLSGPYILFMVIFTLIPLCVVLYYALTDVQTGAFSLKNMENLVLYLPAFGRSILYSLVSALICLLIGYPVAYFMASCKPVTQKFLYMLVMLPMCMSFLLRTLAWVGLLQDTGIINSFLTGLGLPQLQLIRTPGAVILGMVYNYLPYMVLPIYSVLAKIDNRLIEAAQDLGCNRWQTLYKVTLPLSISGIISGITMVFVPSISTFFISKSLSDGRIKLIGDVIETQINMHNVAAYNLGSALSFVLMVLILLSLFITNKFGDTEEGGVVV